MRQLRSFQTNRCYHLVSRVAHRAFYLNEEERTRFIHSFAPVDWARDLLAVLADKPKRPAGIRRELGVSSSDYFTSFYLTPLAAAGFIASEGDPHSPQRTYRLTAKGRRVLA